MVLLIQILYTIAYVKPTPLFLRCLMYYNASYMKTSKVSLTLKASRKTLMSM